MYNTYSKIIIRVIIQTNRRAESRECHFSLEKKYIHRECVSTYLPEIIGHLNNLHMCDYTYSNIWTRQFTTSDSHYLEVQGTLWNTSGYPYLDISDLQNWWKDKSNNHLSQIWICNLTPEIIDLLKIVWKRRAISPLFHNILLPVVRFPCWNRDQNLSSR